MVVADNQKNKDERIFEELGINPTDLEIVDMIVVDRPPSEDDQPARDKNVSSGKIVYIERKCGGGGEARICRVTTSKSGRTLCYSGKSDTSSQ